MKSYYFIACFFIIYGFNMCSFYHLFCVFFICFKYCLACVTKPMSVRLTGNNLN